MQKLDSWKKDLLGKKFNKKQATEGGWYNQGAKNFHYGLPRKKNLWLKKVNPAEKCCHTVWIFLLLTIGKESSIKAVEYEIHHVFLDGRGEVINTPLFPEDAERAKKEILAVCHGKDVEYAKNLDS